MERIFYLLKQSLFVKLALVATLVIGGGNSVWAQKSLPYNYGFENNDLAAEGWTISSHQANTAIYNSSNYPGRNSSTYLFRFYTAYESSPVYQHLISPELSNSSTGIIVSFYYNLFVSSSATREFGVGYSTTDTEVSSFTFTDYSVTQSDKNWYKFTNTFPTGTKYVAIRYKGSNTNFFIDDFSVEVDEVYKRPKSLLVSSFTNSSATLSWTNGSDETAWQIVYSTNENFNPDEATPLDIITNPYVLNHLEVGVPYYAYVRSNYDGNLSGWSNKVAFMTKTEVTVNGDASSNQSSSVPIYGQNVNYLFKSQLIIPSGDLEGLVNNSIEKITFYAIQSDVVWDSALFDVYLKESENNTFTSATLDDDWGTKVGSSLSLLISDNKMEIILDTPFLYTGKNLMIGFDLKTPASAGKLSQWIGKSASNNAVYNYYYKYGDNPGYKTNRTGIAPKLTFSVLVKSVSVTIGSTGYTTFTSGRPLDLSKLPEGVTAYYVASDGVSSSSVKLTNVESTVAAGTGLILKGTAGESYDIPYADSGDAISGNLMIGCTTPKALGKNSAYYVLVNNGGMPEFQCLDVNGATIPAGKAYLNAPAAGARLKFVFDDDNTTTGISSLSSEQRMMNSGTFNLNGQRVDARQKGVYIINGKKVVVK